VTADAVAFIEEALARLQAKGLIDAGPAAFSVRIPGQAAMTFQSVGATEAPEVARSLDFLEAERGQDPILAMHAQVYLTRFDAGAVFTSAQPWATRLGRFPHPMPGIFDEQVRHLGVCVGPLVPGDGAALRSGRNAFTLAAGVLCIGTNRDRAVFNAELLEKCAKAYVLASLTGLRVGTIPWVVRFIAGRRLLKDETLAAQSHARGEVPVTTTGY
jgi:hypothetical protein